MLPGERSGVLSKIRLNRFTAFEALELDVSPGINVLIGENGTGKTHLMKLAYAACDVSKTASGLAEKLIDVFLPSGRALGRLVKRARASSSCSVEVSTPQHSLKLTFSNHTQAATGARAAGMRAWQSLKIESVYIPVKEMLSNAPGFRSLYSQRDIHFEEVYSDILDRAYRPALRGPVDPVRRGLLQKLQRLVEGRVVQRDEEFYLKNAQGNLEFTLLAEGFRKLGLLWLLIQNGTLLNGSVLFWDEPETNLNPRLFRSLMEILLDLHRAGVQVFLASHDYVILKELELARKADDKVVYHSLYRDEDRELRCASVGSYLEIHPNAIQDTFLSLYDRQLLLDG